MQRIFTDVDNISVVFTAGIEEAPDLHGFLTSQAAAALGKGGHTLSVPASLGKIAVADTGL